MTPAAFATYVRYKTRTSSTTFPDAEILSYLGLRVDELSSRLTSETDEATLLLPHVSSLVANQREYSFPSTFLARIRRVEAKLDGTNWLTLSKYDIRQHRKPVNETNIIYYFSNAEGECFYDIQRNALYLYSGTITSVTDGLKLWCETYMTIPSDLTSVTDMSVDPSTTTHGIPRALHRVLADGVVIDYKESKEKPIPLSEREQNHEFYLKKALDVVRMVDVDREINASIPAASYRGNDG